MGTRHSFTSFAFVSLVTCWGCGGGEGNRVDSGVASTDIPVVDTPSGDVATIDATGTDTGNSVDVTVATDAMPGADTRTPSDSAGLAVPLIKDVLTCGRTGRAGSLANGTALQR